MASHSKTRIFLRPPRPLQKSHFGGSNVFLLQFQYKKHLQIAIKHLRSHQLITETVVYCMNRPTPDFYIAISPMGDHLAISGGFYRPP